MLKNCPKVPLGTLRRTLGALSEVKHMKEEEWEEEEEEEDDDEW
jgi:hypothetical protein